MLLFSFFASSSEDDDDLIINLCVIFRVSWQHKKYPSPLYQKNEKCTRTIVWYLCLHLCETWIDYSILFTSLNTSTSCNLGRYLVFSVCFEFQFQYFNFDAMNEWRKERNQVLLLLSEIQLRVLTWNERE